MKLFSCPSCGQRLYFENSRCLACGSEVLYDPDAAEFVLLGSDNFACLNADEALCNWRALGPQAFCRACALNKTIPDLSIEGNRDRWIRVEAAKRRLVYALLSFGLEVRPKQTPDEEAGIAFDFLGDPIGGGPGGEKILTGHDNGVITLNVAEADSVEREKMRIAMGETYRTLLGHFRHEIGHYYWDRLIRDDPTRLASFREIFGDETADYEQALQNHYANPPAPGWQENHITAYAASHPWEDWAETWAHYLHIVDTLEMSDSLGMSISALQANAEELLIPEADGDDGAAPPPGPTGSPFDQVLERWIVLSNASNSINRCMGLPDLYPFVISKNVAAKLAFVDELLCRT
ncbi:zinc-binding metallopeptidase family protein [Mesorhizobium australicum]|uniref:Zinc-ribbon domain-containing protein n=1 Tax=Mesorhizobium australicum TaxID=536018 RepID=A0A1X7MU76_9HYPH|nr:putative zinc-binding metallopeptidase [Mesorhizobium australicum]SMH27503.1 hypothetical protein SAMN02982922_0540 [Mesorhizobium australicum]